jgi:hypothetical protein
MTCTKVFWVCGFLALMARGAQAQKVEVFSLYQCVRSDSGPNLNGRRPRLLPMSLLAGTISKAGSCDE